MKKKLKRLALSRETLGVLETGALAGQVAGGASDTCERTCGCTFERTCGCTLDRTCTCTANRTCTC